MRSFDRAQPGFRGAALLAGFTLIAGILALRAPDASAAPVAVPGSDAYGLATQPALVGTVAEVNDHRIAVDTEQGDQVVLSMDTRTLVPPDLAPGMPMRVEFEVIGGSYYARRIVPIRTAGGLNRELAYARPEAAGELQVRAASTSGGEPSSMRRSSEMEPGESHATEFVPQAIPGTLRYRLATQPMIVGRVVSVNDHQMVVDTEQGEQVRLAMDSRTLVPTDLAPGMEMRAEFQRLPAGENYVSRVVPLRGGMDEGRDLAYARIRSGEAGAQQAAAGEGGAQGDRAGSVGMNAGYTPGSTESSAQPDVTTGDQQPASPGTPQSGETPQNAATQGNADQSATSESAEKPLPRTASSQPLIAALGILALAAAGALGLRRRLRRG